jgi:TPR repeat protein
MGSQEASSNLISLYKFGIGEVEPDEAKARYHLDKAAKSGEMNSLF